MTDPTPPATSAAADVRKRYRYIPALDGMRGFWVVFGPLLYHARPESVPGGPDILPGGILGVDMFFVLSSYLITGIALNEIESTGRLDLVGYAGRRIRRLFPALFTLLAFLTIYLVVLDDADIVSRWTGAIVAALTYCANWYETASGVSYFEQFTNPSPLKHVWSFSIEEQFYLFAPLFIIGCYKWGGKHPRRILLVVSIVGAGVSAWWMARVHIPDADPSRAYYGTDTRAQAFLVGIAMAVLVRQWGPVRSARGRMIVALLAYPATAWFFWMVTNVSERDAWMFENGGFLLAAVMSGVILHGLSQPAPWSPLHRIFESKPFIYVGRISYGLYLYHWPVYLLVSGERAGAVFGRDSLSGYTLLLFHLAITFAIAVVSFHLLEQPFTKRRLPFSEIRLDVPRGALAGSFAVTIILAGLLYANSQRPNDITQVLIPAPAAAAAAEPGAVELGDGEEVFGVPAVDDRPSIDQPATRILVVGDSVAAQIGWALHTWGEEHPGRIVVFNESHLGCGVARYGDKRTEGNDGPVGDVCSNWAVPVAPQEVADTEIVSWPTAIEVFQPDIVLAHVSSWDVVDRIVPGVVEDWTAIGDPVYDEYVLGEYTEATEVLTANDASVFWLMSHYLNRDLLPDDHFERVDGLNEIVLDAIAAFPDETIAAIDYDEFIGPVGEQRDAELRDDGVHLTEKGFAEIGPWLLERMDLL